MPYVIFASIFLFLVIVDELTNKDWRKYKIIKTKYAGWRKCHKRYTKLKKGKEAW